VGFSGRFYSVITCEYDHAHSPKAVTAASSVSEPEKFFCLVIKLSSDWTAAPKTGLNLVRTDLLQLVLNLAWRPERDRALR